MRSFRHPHLSPNEIDAFQLPDPLSDVRTKQNLRRKVAEERKNRLNSERREKRTKGKLEVLEEMVEEMETTTQLTSDENAALHKKLEELTRGNAELKREVGRLTARFNSRVRREPQKIETAVERALSTVFTTQQTIYEVKTRDGTIQSWARNVILHLICASDVPAHLASVFYCCSWPGDYRQRELEREVRWPCCPRRSPRGGGDDC